MPAVVVTPPEPIVTLAQAKQHLRVDDGPDDEYIEDLIAVATGWLDGPDGWLGRALGLQTIEVTMGACLWVADRRLPYPPLVEIVSEMPAADGLTVTVRYRAGYGFAESDGKRRWLGPAPIRHAILLFVGHLYENRMAVTSALGTAEMPMGVEALLSPFRLWSV